MLDSYNNILQAVKILEGFTELSLIKNCIFNQSVCVGVEGAVLIKGFVSEFKTDYVKCAVATPA